MSIGYCITHDVLDQDIIDAWTGYLQGKGSCQYPGCSCTTEGHFQFGSYITFDVTIVDGCLLFRPSANKKKRVICDKIYTHMLRILYKFVDETKGDKGMGEQTKEGVIYYLK
jgi:hypothetical protein